MLFLISIAVITFILFILNGIRKVPNYPPGPPWLPLVGSGLEVKKLSKMLGGQYLALEKLSEQYKTNVLGLKLGKDLVVAVFSYETIKDVLTRDVFEGRPDNFFLRLRCMGQRRGITSTEGEVWNTQRSFVVRHLRNLGFGRQLMEEMIQNELTETISVFENHTNKDMTISKALAPAVLNILWTMTTGTRIPREDCLLKELLDMFERRTQAFDMSGGTLSQHPWLRYILPEWTGYNLITEINFKLRKLVMEVINQHYATWTEGRDDDLIYRYITELKSEKNPMFTNDQLVMVVLDIFIAGASVTSATIDFAILMMILYPEIQEKVQDCIDKSFDKTEKATYADKHRAPYVEAVLLESQRYCTVFPINGPRRALENTTIEGYFIPKDATVLTILHSVNYDRQYWKDPERFRPERFLDENGLVLPYERLTNFGLGKRRCLGEDLAKKCIFAFFVEIFKTFSVTSPPGAPLPTTKPLDGISLQPQDYKVKFIRR